MWFKSKSANRRFERDHVLEVKLRARQVRAARLRMAGKIIGVLLGGALAFCLYWQGSDWAMREWLYKNPVFIIKHLEVQTDGVTPIEQILAWANVRKGDSLLTVDLLRIERDLNLQPLVRNAAAVRVLPDTLKIRVSEREPIARISGFQTRFSEASISPTTYYIDAAGYVMLPLETAQASGPAATGSEDFPVLTGVLGTELRPGRRVESVEIYSALRFIAAFDRSPMFGVVDLLTIDLSSPPVLRVATRQHNEVTFAPEDLARQLARWRVVHDFAIQEARQISSLDLSVSNNVPLRWQDPGAPVPPPARLLKPSSLKKKHV
ncbi:MAG: FtsQ-type POTRA domain-containing protein [Verrucomicrobia bacterium]|nr:FtsQ-type POTRA domain-containing protein [Verrucomicrobiota bacterium]